MRRFFYFFISFFLVFALTGCAFLPKNKSGLDRLPGYSGPKAKVSIADFDVIAAKADREVGVGLREMLVTALSNSNRFTIIEPKAPQSAEQEAGERQENGTKAADLIVAATVEEFEPQASGGKEGLGGGGGVDSGLMGGLLGRATKKAHIKLEIRILDALSQAVLAATMVQGQAQEAAAGSHPDLDNRNLGLGLSAYVNSPMEKAIRDCMAESMRYISQAIPADYYKY